MRKIIGIIVHHSAGPSTETVDQIRRFHVNVRGWSDIGYHWVIHELPAGPWTVEAGRPEERMGAHDDGQNEGTIGVVICGDYTKGPVPADAWSVMVATVANICRRFSLSAEAVEGHKEHETPASATACPGFDPQLLRQAVAEQLRRAA